MRQNIVNKKALRKIKDIHKLSKLYNKKVKRNHKIRLIELMKEHTDEIEELFKKKDKHYLIETGDLLILCMELLLENKKSIDNVMSECLKRYEKKLPRLIRNHG